MLLSRRLFVSGLVSSLAAPAIVRAQSIMPVKALPSSEDLIRLWLEEARENINRNLYGDLADITRKAFVPRLYVEFFAVKDFPLLRA